MWLAFCGTWVGCTKFGRCVSYFTTVFMTCKCCGLLHCIAAVVISLCVFLLLNSHSNIFSASYCMFHFLPRCMECRRGLAMRFLSVRPTASVKLDCDKTKEKSVQIFITCESSFTLVLWEKEWLVGGDLFYLKFWVNGPPLERNRRFWTNNRS